MFRKTVLALATANLALAAAMPARAAETPPVQLLQPGDAQMTCQAVATEINALTVADAKPRKKKGLGGFGKLLGSAAPMLAGPLALPLMMKSGSGIAGQLMTQAMGMAQQGASEAALQSQVDTATAAANPTQSVEGQRKARLMGFFTQKGC